MQRKQAAHAVSLYLDISQASTYRKIPDSPSVPPLRSSENSKTHPVVNHPCIQESPVNKAPLIPETPNEALTPFKESMRVAKPTSAFTGNVQRMTGASWETQFTRLAEEIEVRHYSPKTLKTYRHWMRHFQAFTRSKPPETLSAADVKEFLTWLAVKKGVSASTQNQAFNALLFLYRYVLQQEFGKLDGVVRAKRRP